MVVDSFLELYTTLFGWAWYGVIWDVLKDTGLLLLPFLGIVIDKSLEYRKSDEDGLNEEVILRSLEVDLVIALFVLLFAGAPFKTLDAQEVVYQPRSVFPTVIGAPDEVDANDSGTTFGSTAFTDYPAEVAVPVWWYMVLSVSGGLNRSVMEGVPDRADLRFYSQMLASANIEDPALRQEVNEFFRDCYVPALSRYQEENPDSPAIDAILDTHGSGDPYWLGSRLFLQVDGYYNYFRAANITPPFLYSPVRDIEWDIDDDNLPIFGKPFCNEWWNQNDIGIKDRILETQGPLVDIASIVEAGLDSDRRGDLIVKNILRNGPAEWMPRGYDYAYDNITRPPGSIEAEAERTLKALSSDIATVFTSLDNAIEVTLFLNLSHQFQAIVLMFVFVFLPFVLLISKFDLGAIFFSAWAILTIKFFSVIWFIVWWIDQNLFAAMYPEPGMLTELHNIIFSEKRILLNYVTTRAYMFAPIIFLVISGWGGYNLLSSVMTLKSHMISGATAAGKGMAGKFAKGAGRLKGMKT